MIVRVLEGSHLLEVVGFDDPTLDAICGKDEASEALTALILEHRPRDEKPQSSAGREQARGGNQAGADPDLADGEGVTPLRHARSRGYRKIEAALLAAGAATALELASEGVSVVVHGRDKERAEAVAAEVRAKGVGAAVAITSPPRRRQEHPRAGASRPPTGARPQAPSWRTR